jgi:hypothetical protein
MSLKCWCPPTFVFCVLTQKEPPVQGVPWSVSRGVKQPVLEADHFHLSGAKVRIEQNYTYISPCAVMA